MRFNQFIGIDISKATLDICLFDGEQILDQFTCPNSTDQLQKVFYTLKSKRDLTSVLICAEHTGIYSSPLIEVSRDFQAPLWLENPAEIKLRSGVNRGKNDRIDSIRIASYAARFCDKANLVQINDTNIQKLKYLTKEADMFLTDRAKYKAQLKDQKDFIGPEIYKHKARRLKNAIQHLTRAIKEIEQHINDLIKSNPTLARQFDQLTSIDGIGKQTAIQTIIATQGFSRFSDPRKFCCHAGVAPFAYLSGSSQKTSWRVSHRANKQLKKLFHMAALSAITMEGELKEYYLRKVEQGKNKMSVINAVRAKLIHRVFAVIRDNRKYEKNYVHTLA